MADFSISDVAFAGFGVVRQRPRAVAAWALVQLAFDLIGGGVFAALAGPELMRLRGTAGSAPVDPGQILALFSRLAPAYALAFLAIVLVNAVLSAAINRAVLRPADDRYGYLRLGADELRQLGLFLLVIALAIAAETVAVMVGSALGVGVATMSRPAAMFAGFLLVAALFCGTIFVAVRLSLAWAQTFAEGRVNLFGSWRLTRGRFWPIFGTYLMVVAVVIVIEVLIAVILIATAAVVGGGDMLALMTHPDLTLAGFLTPFRLVETTIGALFAALVLPVVGAPPAALYRHLAGP